MNVAGDDWRDYTPLAHHLTFGDWILREIFIHHPVHLFSWKPRSLLKTATVTPHHKVAPPWRTRRASPVHMGTLQWSFPKKPRAHGLPLFFLSKFIGLEPETSRVSVQFPASTTGYFACPAISFRKCTSTVRSYPGRR